jgi:hypothetical protein
MPGRAREAIPVALSIALVLAGAAAVSWSLLVKGPFDWHVGTPEYWQGALEVFALWLLAWAALSLRGPLWVRAPALLLPVVFYLRRHHVDAVALVSVAYIEGWFALGALALRRARGDWLREFVAGVAIFALLLWLAQLAGYGLPRTQRLLAIVVLVPALLLRWRHWQVVALLRAALATRGDAARDHAAWRAFAAAAIATMCMLFARSNHVFDFDSLWYGFRPERVLVGEHSVFDALGLISPVHYFPKLWEVLTLPLAAARETSLIEGPAILCSGLIARLCHDQLRALGQAPATALGGALLAWTIPALANSALGAKPDVFASLCVLGMAAFAWRRWALRDTSATPWMIACAGLAVSSKLAVLPYVGVAGAAGLVAAWRVPAADTSSSARRAGWAIVAVCTVVGLLVCGRTWWVADIPTVAPEQLVSLWHWLGMEPRLPVGKLDWTSLQSPSAIPGVLVGWIVDPSRFSHLQASWPGHVWLLLPLAATMLPRVPAPAVARWPLWLLPACGLALLLSIAFTNPGGDGNYFIVAVTAATVAAVDLLARRCVTPTLRRGAWFAIGTACVFHILVGFTTAAFSNGTRAWDLDLKRSNRDSEARGRRELEAEHLDGVADWLHGQGGRMRVLGMHSGFWLPARYEDASELVVAHWQRRDEPGWVERLLSCTGAEAFLLSVEPHRYWSDRLDQFIVRLRELPESQVLYRDEHWILLSLRGRLPRCEP